MDDIAPELLAKIEAAFKAECEKDKSILHLYKQIQEGTATYAEAHQFAAKTGDILAGVFGREITADALPDGRMYYNIAQRVLTPMLTEAAEIISDAAMQVQKSLNAAAGIGIKPIRAEVDAGRIEGFVNKVSSAERFEDVASVLGEPVTRYAQSVVDDTIKANAEFQRKAGLRPKITRDAGANCCQWCADLEGTYIYGDHPDEIFQRHAFCRCTVTYDPGDGKITDVWSKKEYKSRDEAVLENRKTLGLADRGTYGRKTGTARKKEAARKYTAPEKSDWQKALQEKVKSGEYNLKLSHQKYLKHVDGSAQYKQYAKGMGQQPSKLTVTEDEAQKIIYQYAGKGDPRMTRGGFDNVEFVTVNRTIGAWQKTTGEWVDTSRVAIYYGENNSHIVPVKELEK